MRRSEGRWWLLAASIALEGTVARSSRGDAGPTDVTVRGALPSSPSGFVGKASEADATREVTDVASLLEPLPGIHVRRLGADDTFSTLSIRGSTSSEVMVLFAGVPLTGAADPSLDLASLPLWPGARVKVYRSFTPAAVGSGSLGGTLTLEPPKPSDPEGTVEWAGVGSFGLTSARLADVRAIDGGRGRVVTALSASRADDDFSYYDATHAAYATRQNAQHAAIQGLVSVALPVPLGRGEPGTLTTTALVQSRLQHLPGSVDDPTLFAVLSTNRELASLDLATPTSGTSALHVLLWGRRDETANRDQPAPAGYHDVQLATDDVTTGLGSSLRWRGSLVRRVIVDARVDGSFERFAPGDDQSVLGIEPGATRASFGGGADVEARPIPRWALDASGRVDASVDSVDGLTGLFTTPPTQGTDVRPTGHIGSETTLGSWVFAAHGGALARPPSFVEKYGGGGVLPSPTLLSESAITADAGVAFRPRLRRLRADVELTGFATHADQLITLVPEGAFGFLKAENIASARLFGVEGSADVRGYGLDVRAAYTGLLTFNDDPSVDPASPSRPPLPGRPAHDFVGDVAYTFGPVRARYGVDVLAKLTTDNAGDVAVPTRVLQSTGVRLAIPWVRGLRAAFDVSNLADVRTGVAPGSASTLPGAPLPTVALGDQFQYPLPGRTFLFTLRWAPSEDPPSAPR